MRLLGQKVKKVVSHRSRVLGRRSRKEKLKKEEEERARKSLSVGVWERHLQGEPEITEVAWLVIELYYSPETNGLVYIGQRRRAAARPPRQRTAA